MTSEAKKFIPLDIAVLTISDSRTLADDKSGSTLAERLTAAGHRLAAREIEMCIRDSFDISATQSPTTIWLSEADSNLVRGALADAPRRDTTMTQIL